MNPPTALDLTEMVISKEKRLLWEQMTDGDGCRCYVLGRNKYAESVAAVLPIEAFIDDYTREESYLGQPILRMGQVPRNRPVISCVVDARPLTALARLETTGFSRVLSYFDLARLAPAQFRAVDYCAANQADIRLNATKYAQIHARLADDASRQAFAKVVQFRLTLDLSHMHGFTCALERQYFEPFVPWATVEVFIDGGAYDGDTSQRFASVCEGYRRIYCYEPSPSMMKITREKLTGRRDVQFVEKGLFSRNGQLRFDAADGPASRISECGTIEIEVARLDDEIREPVTFLKLDVEGAEYDALEGARSQILSNAPKLAVCVYHDQRDFWRIPDLVLGIHPNYQIYFRHYTEGILESVMFFIPPSA